MKAIWSARRNPGKQRWNFFSAEPFDWVLADIIMPEMNGVELLKAMKQLRPEVPVVLVTAYSEDELLRSAVAEGAVLTLKKPLDINRLLFHFSKARR